MKKKAAATLVTSPISYQRAKYKEQEDWSTIENPVASVKRDGGAFFLAFNEKGEPHYISRRESVKGGFPDRTSQLGELSNVVLPEYAGQVFHVELVHTGFSPSLQNETLDSHSTVSGILNSLPARALATQKDIGPIRAILLDVVHPKLETYGAKINHMKKLASAFGKPNLLQVPSVKIGKVAIQRLIESSKAQGHEGVIITSLTKPESENVRVKLKHLKTYNLVVTGTTEEMDKNGVGKGTVGALNVADATGRDVGKVGTGLSRADRIRKDWVGQRIQVKLMPSPHAKLRQPVYNGTADGELDTVIQGPGSVGNILGLV